MVRAFRQRHDYLVGALNEIPGFSCLPGAGTDVPTGMPFDTAIIVDPQYARAWHNRGVALWRLEDIPRAEESFKQAIAKAPMQAESWAELGRMQAQWEKTLKPMPMRWP